MQADRGFPLILGSVGLLATAIATYTDVIGNKLVVISWFASIFIVLEILTLRFFRLDTDIIDTYLKSTSELADTNGARFLNGITLAMIIGLIATIVIAYNFVFGMIIYLLMHLALIYGFSGIFSLNAKKYFDNQHYLPVISILFWLIAISTIYTKYVQSEESAIVIPYIIVLGTMAHFTWYGLEITKRDIRFRLSPVLGSALFVFSDSLIGNAKFGQVKLPGNLYYFIDFTYVLSLFLIVLSLNYLPFNLKELNSKLINLDKHWVREKSQE